MTRVVTRDSIPPCTTAAQPPRSHGDHNFIQEHRGQDNTRTICIWVKSWKLCWDRGGVSGSLSTTALDKSMVDATSSGLLSCMEEGGLRSTKGGALLTTAAGHHMGGAQHSKPHNQTAV